MRLLENMLNITGYEIRNQMAKYVKINVVRKKWNILHIYYYVGIYTVQVKLASANIDSINLDYNVCFGSFFITSNFNIDCFATKQTDLLTQTLYGPVLKTR